MDAAAVEAREDADDDAERGGEDRVVGREAVRRESAGGISDEDSQGTILPVPAAGEFGGKAAGQALPRRRPSPRPEAFEQGRELAARVASAADVAEIDLRRQPEAEGAGGEDQVKEGLLARGQGRPDRGDRRPRQPGEPAGA